MHTDFKPAAPTQAISPVIDSRLIPPAVRQATIFQYFEALPLGGWMDLLADHEPLPLKGQFQAMWPGWFDWQVLEAGPTQWLVRVSRNKPAGKACCGSCS